MDVGQRKSLEKIEAVQEQVNDTSQAPLRMGGGGWGGRHMYSTSASIRC